MSFRWSGACEKSKGSEWSGDVCVEREAERNQERDIDKEPAPLKCPQMKRDAACPGHGIQK